MGTKGGAGAARTMTQSLDNKGSYSMMLWICLTMGTRPPLPLLLNCSKPLHLCSVMLRIMFVVAARDVPGKEREIKGMGKNLERTLFFPFLYLHFLSTFFPVFGENHQKRVKKEVERQKKG